MEALLNQKIHDWLETLKKIRGLSENTLISYKNDFDKFIHFLNHHLSSEVTVQEPVSYTHLTLPTTTIV